MKLLFSAFLAAALTFGADLTGVWRGSFTPERPDGTLDDQQSAYLTLKQEGSKLSGRIGPSEEKNFEIANGVIEGDRLTFDASGDGMQLKITLQLKEGKLEGEVNGEGDGQKRKAHVKFTKD
jgi:hypothetical protein